MPRSKYDMLKEEFPFLKHIIHSDMLQELIRNERVSVSHMLANRLFQKSGRNPDNNRPRQRWWITYTSASVPPDHAEELPIEKPLWQVVPDWSESNDPQVRTRTYIAFVWVTFDHNGIQGRINIFKIYSDSERAVIEDCIYAIRRVARSEY